VFFLIVVCDASLRKYSENETGGLVIATLLTGTMISVKNKRQ
jgi:hypothetical protein